MLERRGRVGALLLSLPALLLLHGCGAAETECSATWQCSGPQCAAVMGGYSGTAGPFASAAECEQWRQTYILTSTCSCGGGGTTSPPPPAPTLQSLSVTPSNPSVPLGATLQLAATGRYSDGSSRDLTASATWSRGVIGSITIGPGGLVTALAPGTTRVSADYQGLSGGTDVRVGAAVLQSIAIAPSDPTIPLGLTQPFSATGVYSNGSTVQLTSVTWASSAPAVATIEVGRVSSSSTAISIGAGVTTITARSAGLVGSTTLTVTPVALVSLSVSPSSTYAAVGFGAQFTATGTSSDGRTQDLTGLASWSSASPGVATVGAAGFATAVAAGSAEITARHAGLSGSASLSVSSATLRSISVSPPSPRVAPGGRQPFVATGTFSDGVAVAPLTGVTWTSSAPGVATVDAAGVATGLALGGAVVTAAAGALQGSADLTVTQTGTRWVPRASTVALSLAAVAWAGERFVAVGDAGTILTSPDGVAWAPQSSGTTAPLAAVTWSGSLVVAVGAGGTILTSPDCLTWTARSSGTAAAMGGVAWSGTQLVAVGSAGTVLTSDDGVTWTARAPATLYALSSVAWDGARFVAAGGFTGSSDAGGSLVTSVDGVTWTEQRIYFSNPVAVAASPAGWVAVGASVSQNIRTGAVTRSGYAATSPDATAWTSRPPGTGSFLSAVAWTGQELIAVGQAGTMLASPDGGSWLPRQSGTVEDLRGVASSGAVLVTVGSGGAILSSP